MIPGIASAGFHRSHLPSTATVYPMRHNNGRYSARRVVTGCALCALSTGTLSAIVLLVLFRVILGDCNITCDERTEGAKQTASGGYECDGT